MVLRGWPDKISDVDQDLQAYWNFRDELCICDGLLMKGDCLITPPSLCTQMLDKIHSSHLGMEKCLNRARDCLFWPGITKQIQEKVEKCQICNRYRNKQVKEPLMPHEVPGRPWQTLAGDLFVFGTDKYLVLVDYYSKYFELNQLSDGTSNTVVNVLKQHFARHGIPELLYSDNGPEFTRKEFCAFARNYQFQHVTSSPRFPQSNGFVERTIQTVKKVLKKAYDDGNDPHLAVLELQNTPIQGVGLSPMQLLMGRRAKTLIPIKQSLLKPMAYNGERIQQIFTQKQQNQKKYYDRASKGCSEDEMGRQVGTSQVSWKSTKGEPRSFVVTANNQEYRRNRRDILKTSEEIPETKSTIDIEHMEESEGKEVTSDNMQEETPETLMNSPVVVSRVSGRIIRKPVRYSD